LPPHAPRNFALQQRDRQDIACGDGDEQIKKLAKIATIQRL